MRLFLIDGSAQIYRAHFAFKNPLRNKQGEITSAVFGFLNTLYQLIEKEQPTHLAIVFDTAEPTFRHQQYSDYKATRQKMPEDLVGQLGRLDQVLAATGITILAKPGWEADDLIGTIAKDAEQKGFEVFMVTADKDYQQLVSERVFLYNLSKEQTLIMGPPQVVEHFGVPPERVIDVLALMGDSSDNVPGVAGIGPKTAAQLVRDFGPLEAVLAAAPTMKEGKTKEALLRDREQALLSKELVTIDCHAPIAINYDSFKLKPIVNPEFERLLNDLELHSILERFRAREGVTAKKVTSERNYHLVKTADQLRQLVDNWRKAKPLLSMDFETTSADPMRAEIVGASFAVDPGTAFYVSVDDLEFPQAPASLLPAYSWFTATPSAGLQEFLNITAPLYSDAAVPKTGQNIKYDALVLSNYGINTNGIVFDSILAAYIINPGSRNLNIDALSRDYLQLPKIATSELIGSGKNEISMRDVPVERVCEYACEDADYALRLEHALKPLLEDQSKILFDIELPLMPVLLRMEQNGIRLDVGHLHDMGKELERDLARIQEECYHAAGESFNLNSPKQLAAILFDKLKLPIQKKTKTGPSTDVDTLTALAALHELPLKLLDYRTLAKLKSTYVDTLPDLIHPYTGRVHSTFSQTVAATGRLASNNPNLQNIPIRTEVGRRIREAFIPGQPGWKLLSADYSQIELRIMAHLSGDETMADAFRRGTDIHAETAAKINNCPLASVTPDMRRAAKTVNFGIIYGQTDFGLSQELGIPRSAAKAFREAYFRLYPGVANFMKSTIELCREKGYVQTIMGRRRNIPDITSTDRNIREFAERTSINTPVQGSAADMIKIAMIGIDRRLKQENFAAKMLLQVHDELVFEVPTQEIESLKEMVTTELVYAIPLSVPVVADVGVGDNWLQAH